MPREAFKRRGCIISASGFFEWTGEKGDKQPHLFTVADGSPTRGGLRVTGAYGTSMAGSPVWVRAVQSPDRG